MQCIASTLHTTSEHGVSSITTADAAHLGCQQSTELTPPSADLNGLVRFSERRNFALYYWRCLVGDWKFAGSIPDGVTGMFPEHNPSGRAMSLGLTQSLTKMRTRNIS